MVVTVSGGVSSWSTITTTNTADKRWRTAPVLFQNKIYTFGGYNGDPGQIYNDVRKFDIITKTWSTVSTTGATPAKREPEHPDPNPEPDHPVRQD